MMAPLHATCIVDRYFVWEANMQRHLIRATTIAVIVGATVSVAVAQEAKKPKPCNLQCLQKKVAELEAKLANLVTKADFEPIRAKADAALTSGTPVQLGSFRWGGKCLDQPISGGGAADSVNATNCSAETRWRIERNGS